MSQRGNPPPPVSGRHIVVTVGWVGGGGGVLGIINFTSKVIHLSLKVYIRYVDELAVCKNMSVN